MKNTEIKTQETKEHMQTAGNIRWEDRGGGLITLGTVGKEPVFCIINKTQTGKDVTVVVYIRWIDERVNIVTLVGCIRKKTYPSKEDAKAKAEEIFAQWLDRMGLEVKKPHRCDTCQKWLDEVCP